MTGSMLVGAKLSVILTVLAGTFLLEVVLPHLLSRLRRGLKTRRARANAAALQTEEPGWVRERKRTEGVLRAEAEAKAEAGAKAEEEARAESLDEAEGVWTSARELVHNESPDFSTDWQYLTLVYRAAELGHLEAMSKLGDYAIKRGNVVEAFYWKHRVEMGGGRCRNPSLANIIRTWTEVGCPAGIEAVSASLSAQRADFAHAVLCLKSGIDPRYGTMRLKELADADVEDAKRFLKRR